MLVSFMAKYQWDIYKLRKLRDLALNNKEITNNKDLFDAVKDLYSLLFQDYNINKIYNLNEEDFYESIAEDLLTYTNIEAATIAKDLSKNVKNIKTKENKLQNLRIFLNNDQLIDLTRELIRLIPSKNINLAFDEYFNPKNNLINIQYAKYPTEIYGNTIIDFTNNIGYINIFRQNTLIDIITTFHEFFHIYLRKNENYNYIYSKKVISARRRILPFLSRKGAFSFCQTPRLAARARRYFCIWESFSTSTCGVKNS